MPQPPLRFGIAFAACLFGGAATALCQGKKGEESLEEKLEKTLREPFFKNAPWITDYDEALAQSKATGKPIFAYFTRSYAY